MIVQVIRPSAVYVCVYVVTTRRGFLGRAHAIVIRTG